MNKEKIRTEKERKRRINCTKQKLTPNGTREHGKYKEEVGER
jgi:hypothetical protein